VFLFFLTRAIQVVNTQMAACVSGLIWMLLDWWHDKRPSLVETLNGIVAGLAGITPASGFIEPYWCLLVSTILGKFSPDLPI
jgi:Amt family ammonium transporter